MNLHIKLYSTAGVDEKGATDGLRFLPSDEAVMGHAVQLFEFKS